MSFSEFVDGYLSTLRWSASSAAQQSLRREIRRTELTAVLDSIRDELTAFWVKHGDAILVSKGIEGCSQSVSWQAGHDLCFARNALSAFRAGEWSGELSTSILSDAKTLGRVRIDTAAGTVTVNRDSLVRIG